MILNAGIRAENIDCCRLCGKRGEKIYGELKDRLFRAPGLWSLVRCRSCSLVWLNPRPVPEDIGKLYTTYSTQVDEPVYIRPRAFRDGLRRSILSSAFGYPELLDSRCWGLIGRVSNLIPALRETAGLHVRYLGGEDRGTLLDVGCGTGGYLLRMKKLGWDVLGVEPDLRAVEIAREKFQLPVIHGTLEQADLPEDSVDAVVMHHVIEHVHDPVATLKGCRRILRRNGKLTIVTPNIQSLGHRVFNRSWFALEPPRHLHLFSCKSMRLCVEKAGLQIQSLTSTARTAREIWSQSYGIWENGRCDVTEENRQTFFAGWIFQVMEEATSWFSKTAGEELVLLAVKGSSL